MPKNHGPIPRREGAPKRRVAPSPHLRVVDERTARRRTSAESRSRPATRRGGRGGGGGKGRSRSPGRLIFVFFLLALLFSGMIGRLFQVQVLHAEALTARAADQREREIEFPARRGAIFDRTGEPLALSVDLNMVYTDHLHVDDAATTAKKLAPLLGFERDVLLRKLTPSSPADQFEYLARQVLPRTARKVKALDLPGIYLRPEPKRYYPNGRLASQLLGFVNLDGTVTAGVESQYESILEGTPGRMVLEQDPTGRATMPNADYAYVAPQPGRSLFLTIDKELQYFTELTLSEAVKTYKAAGGTAIVMSPSTGEVLALANAPDFNPNNYSKASQEVQRNAALTDVYEPGSAFKIVATAAAIEEGVVTPKTKYTVPDAFQYYDRVFNDSHTHPTETMTVAKIIEQSSNVGTIKMGLDLGGDKLDEWIRRFGFGRKTGLDFPGESAGIVLPRESWSGTTIATLPIGQGIAVTPVQMAAAYGAVANRGVWVEPKLLHGTMDHSGAIERSSAPGTRRIMSRETASKVGKILTAVVDRGTGVEAAVPGYAVAGKTGTAQKPLPTGGYGNSYIASFAGFAPAENPAAVVIVILDEPRPIWGGSTAAPTFQTIMEFTLRHLGASPTGNAEKAAREIEQAKVPAAHD